MCGVAGTAIQASWSSASASWAHFARALGWKLALHNLDIDRNTHNLSGLWCELLFCFSDQLSTEKRTALAPHNLDINRDNLRLSLVNQYRQCHIQRKAP